MRLLRDALQDLVEQEFDPVLRAAPVNGYDVSVLTRMKHGEVISCMRHACMIVPESLESGEKIREWARKITATSTVTYAILDRCFSYMSVEEWVDLEDINYALHGTYLEKSLFKALERLVRVTHHKLYKLDFVVESDEKGRYRIARRKVESKSRAKLTICKKMQDDDDGIDAAILEEIESLASVDPEMPKDDDGATYGADTDVDFGEKLFRRKPLSREDQRRMLIEARSKDPKIARKATNELVKRNIRFVVWWAGKMGIFKDNPVFWDVIQEGLRGVEHTIQKIELGKGEFSTYASWWVRSYMQRFLERDKHVVGVPYWAIELLTSIKKAMREAEGKGRPLSVKDIAEMTGKDIKIIERILAIDDIREFSTSDTMEDEHGDYVPANRDLEKIIMEMGLSDLGSKEAETGAMVKFEAMNLMEILRATEGMIRKRASASGSRLDKDELSDRDMYMLLRRMDLYDMPWADVTVQDIADECGVFKQRVNQIINDTIRPFMERAMRGLGYDEEKIKAYKELLGLWMMSSNNMAEAKRESWRKKNAAGQVVADASGDSDEFSESFEEATGAVA